MVVNAGIALLALFAGVYSVQLARWGLEAAAIGVIGAAFSVGLIVYALAEIRDRL